MNRTTNLQDTLSELDREFPRADAAEQHRAARHLQRLIADAEPARKLLYADDDMLLFDNVPI